MTSETPGPVRAATAPDQTAGAAVNQPDRLADGFADDPLPPPYIVPIRAVVLPGPGDEPAAPGGIPAGVPPVVGADPEAGQRGSSWLARVRSGRRSTDHPPRATEQSTVVREAVVREAVVREAVVRETVPLHLESARRERALGAAELTEREDREPVGDSTVDTNAPRRRRRMRRRVLVGLGAALLLGPFVYSLGTGAGGDRPSSPGGAALPAARGPGSPPAMVGAFPELSDSPSTAGSAPSSAPASGPGATGSSAATGIDSGSGPNPSALAAAGPTTPPAVTFTAISGPGCPANSDVQNWYTNGYDSRWHPISGGVPACGGEALAMPMSGSAGSDGTPFTVWWFETAPVVTGTCAVSVYIPSSGSAVDVAGRPAYYKILGGRTSSTPKATFTIDQTARRGSWVAAGSYPVTGGGISIHLANRGVNANGEHLGVGQVRVSCTAA